MLYAMQISHNEDSRHAQKNLVFSSEDGGRVDLVELIRSGYQLILSSRITR